MIEILTGLLVLITGYYAWTTNRIHAANREAVAAMREQSEAMTRPYVQPSIGLLPGSLIFVLKIRNTGRTTARNIRLATDKDFYLMGKKQEERNLRNLNAFKEPIACFPPDAELSFWLTTGPEIFGPSRDPEVLPQVFTVTATYEFGDKTVSETTTIDFRPFLSSDLPRDSVVHELKEITRAVQKVSENVRKL